MLALEDGRMRVAAGGGSVEVARVRASGGKQSPQEAGIAVGEKLG